jgi:putative SOS response-associated peptidase YedK
LRKVRVRASIISRRRCWIPAPGFNEWIEQENVRGIFPAVLTTVVRQHLRMSGLILRAERPVKWKT